MDYQQNKSYGDPEKAKGTCHTMGSVADANPYEGIVKGDYAPQQ